MRRSFLKERALFSILKGKERISSQISTDVILRVNMHRNSELRTEGNKPDISIFAIYTAHKSSVSREVS
jgi:hypothetical protein